MRPHDIPDHRRILEALRAVRRPTGKRLCAWPSRSTMPRTRAQRLLGRAALFGGWFVAIRQVAS